MSSRTRGPRPGKVPPHIQQRVERKHTRAVARASRPVWYRRAWFLAAVAGVVALVAGVVIGRATAPDPVGDNLEAAAGAIGTADAAELTWAFGLQTGAPSVESARTTFDRDGAAIAAANVEQWLASYDQFIAQLEIQATDPAVDGVRRLVLASVRSARDGAETLGAAAAADGPAQQALLTQVERLRARALELDFDARQLYAALGGDLDGGLPAPPSPGPSLPRPSPPQPSGSPSVAPSGGPSGSPSETEPSEEASDDRSPRGGRGDRSERESEPAPEPTASAS